MPKKDKLNKLIRAHNRLTAAITDLQQIADDKSDHYFICEDARHFVDELNTLVYKDGGLASLIRIVERKV